MALVKDRHPYELPGMFALPMVGASEEYAEWVRKETDGQL